MGINCTKFRSGQKNGKGVRQPDRGWSPWYSYGFALAKFLPLAVAVCECRTNTGKRYVCFESPTLLHVQSALIQFEYSHDADFSSSHSPLCSCASHPPTLLAHVALDVHRGKPV